MVYSFSPPMQISAVSCSLISKLWFLFSVWYIMNIRYIKKKKVKTLAHLKTNVKNFRWTSRQEITSDALTLFHFYKQLFEVNSLTSTDFYQHFSAPSLPLMNLHSPYWGNFCTCAWHSLSEQPWCTRALEGAMCLHYHWS